MHLTAPQVVGRRSDFSDSDKLAYALQWYSGIQADAFQRALWNSRGLSGGKLIERLISRVDGIVNSWFKESDEGTGQFTIILIRDTDLPETPEDAELDHAAAARKSRASEKKDVGDRGRMVSMGRWVHRDQDWYEKEGKEKEEEEKKSKNASMSVTKGQEDIEVNKLSAITSSSGDGSGRPKGDSYIADLNRRWLTKFLIGKAHYELSYFMTLPSHQRHGAGGVIMDYMLPDAYRKQEPCWIESTDAGVSFYKHHGFRVIDTDFVNLEDLFDEGKGPYTHTALWRDPNP